MNLEIVVLAAILIAVGLIGVQARALTSELARLNAFASKLAPLADELAPVAKDIPKWAKLRKPLVAFMKTGTEGFAMPAKIIELTRDHLEQLTSIASGAVMAHDMMEAEKKRRAENPAPGPLAPGSQLIPLPNPPANGGGGGSVAIKQTEKAAEPLVPKYDPVLGLGANNGRVERVNGRVEMGPPVPPIKIPSGDPPRDLSLGAASSPDGTAS